MGFFHKGIQDAEDAFQAGKYTVAFAIIKQHSQSCKEFEMRAHKLARLSMEYCESLSALQAPLAEAVQGRKTDAIEISMLLGKAKQIAEQIQTLSVELEMGSKKEK